MSGECLLREAEPTFSRTPVTSHRPMPLFRTASFDASDEAASMRVIETEAFGRPCAPAEPEPAVELAGVFAGDLLVGYARCEVQLRPTLYALPAVRLDAVAVRADCRFAGAGLLEHVRRTYADDALLWTEVPREDEEALKLFREAGFRAAAPQPDGCEGFVIMTAPPH